MGKVIDPNMKIDFKGYTTDSSADISLCKTLSFIYITDIYIYIYL